MVPSIETARLRLRSFHEGDLDAHAEMLGDPAVARYLGGTVSREESWRKLLAAQGLWSILGYGYWAVERHEDGAVLGQIGFADFKRDMVPSIENVPEMGWIFAPHAHGYGYASEAAAACLDWAAEALKGREIVAIIEPGNAASIHLAEKMGFTNCGEARYKEGQIFLFRLPSLSPAATATAATAPA